MIRITQHNYGKGINRCVYDDDKFLATIGHHPDWRKQVKHKLSNVQDAWNVCWHTGRVDWHNTLADAKDNALKGL